MKTLKKKTKFFKALSDPNRLRILKMLQVKEMCVCEITDVLQLAASTVSKHLQVLRDEGFITEEKSGKWVNYSINPLPSDHRVSTLLSMLDFWISDEQTVLQDLHKVESVNRHLLCGK